MSIPLVYHYDSQHKNLTGTSLADSDPLQVGVWLYPANSTLVPPPDTSPGYTPVFNGTSWESRPDNSGVWYNSDGLQITFDSFNQDPSGLTRDPRPAAAYILQGGLWVYSQEKADQLWSEKLFSLERDVKEFRDTVQYSGVQVDAHWFHTDLDSITKYLALRSLGSSVSGISWKTMSGEFVVLTEAKVNEIFLAAFTKIQTTFAVAESHLSAIRALTPSSPAYDFTVGWPESFQPTKT